MPHIHCLVLLETELQFAPLEDRVSSWYDSFSGNMSLKRSCNGDTGQDSVLHVYFSGIRRQLQTVLLGNRSLNHSPRRQGFKSISQVYMEDGHKKVTCQWPREGSVLHIHGSGCLGHRFKPFPGEAELWVARWFRKDCMSMTLETIPILIVQVSRRQSSSRSLSYSSQRQSFELIQ